MWLWHNPIKRLLVYWLQALEKQPETTLWQIASLPQVLQLSESEEDEQAVCYVVEQAFSQAIGQLKAMREKEGEKALRGFAYKGKGSGCTGLPYRCIGTAGRASV